ncbi:hypothetical protein BTJ48_03250 [Bacillus mycoides]|nr:hypothetical protein BTJ45_05257 [Bacillus mycoides]OSY07234.1 hypothetical protein BTJ48_03250 [Bacillus mycoides]
MYIFYKKQDIIIIEEQFVSPIEICGKFTWDMKCIFEKR